MISLCSETLKIAETKNNFSMWVRAQLLKDNKASKYRRFRYECLDCGYAWERMSESLDKYFFCPNMMKEECSNKQVLKGLEMSK